jgi:hypothetical protein
MLTGLASLREPVLTVYINEQNLFQTWNKAMPFANLYSTVYSPALDLPMTGYKRFISFSMLCCRSALVSMRIWIQLFFSMQ